MSFIAIWRRFIEWFWDNSASNFIRAEERFWTMCKERDEAESYVEDGSEW